jgi:hypothetical protein
MAKETVGESSKVLKDIQKSVETVNKRIAESTKKATDSYEDIVDYSGELLNNLIRQDDLLAGIAKLHEEIEDATKGANKLAEFGNSQLAKELKLSSESAKVQKEQAENTLKLLQLRAKYLTLSEKERALFDKNVKLAEKYNDIIKESLSFVEDISDTIEEIPVVGGILSKLLGTEELKEKLHEIATEDLKNLGAEGKFSLKTVGKGFKDVITKAGPLLPLVLGIAGAFKLIEFGIDIDKETTELARNLGVSKEEAHELHHEMIAIQRASDNALMTIKNMSLAMTALNAATGLNASITEEMLTNQVLLTNNLGLASEDAADLNKELKASGLNAETITIEMVSAVKQFNDATGAGLSIKDVLTEVAKVSGKVKANFRSNFKELTLQVAKAKALGITLDKIYEMGRKSLDIESSITSEFEASVLLGKSINLNAFRQASLAGDTAAMMAEMNKYAGTYTDFQAMNILQREKLSESFGMDVDAMADMLKQQDLLNELGVDSLDGLTEKQILNSSLNEDQQKELLTQMKLADVTDKLAKAAESLKNIFAGLATAFEKPIELITWLLNRTEALQSVIYAIGGYLGGKYLANMILGTAEIFKQIQAKGLLATLTKQQIVDEGIITGEKEVGAIADTASETAKFGQAAATGAALGEQSLLTGEAVVEAAAKTASATAMSFGALLPVILGGVAAAGALIYSFMDDGVVSPTGPSGYSRVLSGPEGSIALNDNDTIVAGTDLNSGGGGSNMSRVEALLEKLIAKVDQPVYINMGGKVIDELDNRITLRKTYTTKVDSGYGVFG